MESSHSSNHLKNHEKVLGTTSFITRLLSLLFLLLKGFHQEGWRQSLLTTCVADKNQEMQLASTGTCQRKIPCGRAAIIYYFVKNYYHM